MATHSDTEGQETPAKVFAPRTPSVVQCGVCAAGLVEVTMLRRLSTPTQRPVDGQEMLVRYVLARSLLEPVASSARVTCQACAPALGAVEMTTLPPWSVAAQNETEAQAMLVKFATPSTCATRHVSAFGPLAVSTSPA
jgi:hypothetical protein